METAEVVIVGAGVVGASVAYHLAARGCRDVVLLDRAVEPGAGSTGRATGGFRTQFATEVNVRLSLLARSELLRFRDELGVDPGYEPRGYLFVAETELEAEAMRAALVAQRAAGLVESHEVASSDLAEINWHVRAEGTVAGFFCPLDGFLRPTRLLEGYLDGARRLGVRVCFGVGDVRFDLDGDRIAAVRSDGVDVASRAVVNAAGAWAAEVGRLAGASVPVTPVRRQMALTKPFDRLPADMPMTIFLADSFHVRMRDGRAVVGRYADTRRPDEPFDTCFDPTLERPWLEGVSARARERVPALVEAEFDLAGCWAGLYEVSPDKHALLGPSVDVRNLFLANGSSGHGVMHAPALGTLLAEILVDGRASSLDATPLRPSRFAEGRPNVATEIL